MNIKLNDDICSIISKYIYKPKYKLLDWININDLNFISLSSNPYAIDLLKENKNKINWDLLSSNPNAIFAVARVIFLVTNVSPLCGDS